MVETKICTIPGCDMGPGGRPWESPAGITTYAARSAEVRNHLDMDHYSLFAKKEENKEVETTKTVKKEGFKVENKIDRPKLKSKMSEIEWTRFTGSWKRFKNSCKLEDDDLCNQLWECMDEETEITMLHKGYDNITEVEEVMGHVKRLVCKKISKLSS